MAWFKTREKNETRIGNTAGEGTMSVKAAKQFAKMAERLGDTSDSKAMTRALNSKVTKVHAGRSPSKK